MSDQYTVELGFNRPVADIRRMSDTLARIAAGYDPQDYEDIQYASDVMDEIADKMEEQVK